MKQYPIHESKELAVYDDPVDKIEPEPPHPKADLAAVMHRLIVWQLLGGEPKRIGARTLVLAQSLGVDLGKALQTEADIARATGLTRSAVSLIVNELRDQFGLINKNNRTERNRQRCKQAQKKRSPQRS